MPTVTKPKMDDRSDTLSSSKTAGSTNSEDEAFQNLDLDGSPREWYTPIVTCIKRFRGGGLIVHSVHFRAAIEEAEKIWVERNTDYDVGDGQEKKKPGNGFMLSSENGGFHSKTKEDEIGKLEMELHRLSMENEELRMKNLEEKSQELPDVEHITKMYSDLYNNEWGDAFSYLTRKKKVKEKDAIEELLKVAEYLFEMCDKTARDQMIKLTENLCIPCQDRQMLKKIQLPDCHNLPNDVMKQLYECRKMTWHHSCKVVEQVHLNSERILSKLPKNESFRQFTTKCIQCFWQMKVQNPPMHLKFKIKKRSPFYPEAVMNYGKPGSEIDYLVWPAVLLYESGPLALKGLVQCL